MYFGWYSSHSHLNNIRAPRAGITTFSVPMATPGVANQFKQHGLQIAENLANYSISSGMSVFGANIQRTNSEIMCILRSKIYGGITTYIECSAMPTARPQMPNSRHAMFTKDSTCFNTFTVL